MANQTRLIEELRRQHKTLKRSIMAFVISVGSEIETFDQIKSFSSALSSRVPEFKTADHQMTMQEVIEQSVIKAHNINAILWITSDNKRSKDRHFNLVSEEGLSEIKMREVWTLSDIGSCAISKTPKKLNKRSRWPRRCLSTSQLRRMFQRLRRTYSTH